MGTSLWSSYKYQTENHIVTDLIREEIDQLSRRRENIAFRCVLNRRVGITAFWGILALLGSLLFLLRDGPGTAPITLLLTAAVSTGLCWKIFHKEKFVGAMIFAFLGIGLLCFLPILLFVVLSISAGPVLSLVYVAIWVVRMCFVTNRRAPKYLAKLARKEPAKEISRIVAEDCYDRSQEHRPAGSVWVHILVMAAVVVCSWAGPVMEARSRVRQDGMLFEPCGEGYMLVDCDSDFSRTMVFIPSQVEGLPVVAIDSGAFMNETTIQTVNIPDTVTSIGAEAFSGCTQLQSIVIPEGVTEIRGNCFENCTSLKSVTLHDGITAIHGYAFRGCSSLMEITLPAGITEIRGNCFEYCTSLRSIVIPEGVTRIAAHAFMGCTRLETVVVPGTVAEIGSSAFRECPALMEITIPQACVVNERAFKGSPTVVTRK